ncbi:MAG TPA: tetratricopeptide repeat protein [Roseiflexaceae bacterium]|nr:tetratricopeptide repeat protein [Roseiflexaceae bacterium]
MLADDARDVAQVRPLLPPVGCALLVTSRQRFTLDGMAPLDLERLEEGAAVALLRGICPHLTEEQAQQIARLCGYLPLALRVSGGILLNDPALSPERYLARLATQPLAELRDPDDPGRDVGVILRLSYTILDVSAQAVFRRLGVLAADADLPLIAALLELPESKVDEVLRTLLRRSLVEYNSKRDCWSMHDLVRACALRLLAEAGEEREVRLCYAERLIGIIEQAVRDDPLGDRRLVGLSLLDRALAHQRERAHLEAVRAWLWEQTHAADIDTLVFREANVTTLQHSLYDHAQKVDVPRQKRGLAAARWLGDRALEGRALNNLGAAYRGLREFRRSIELCEQALTIAREIDDRQGEYMALSSLGFAYTYLGEERRANDFNDQAMVIAWLNVNEQQLAIARREDDRLGEGYALSNLGVLFLQSGDAAQARTHCEEALALARDLEDRSLEGTALRNLANALAALDQPNEADACYVQSLAIHDELGSQSEAARTRWFYGHFLIQQGDHERGLALLDACVAYEQQIGHAQATEHAALVEQLRLDSAQAG